MTDEEDPKTVDDVVEKLVGWIYLGVKSTGASGDFTFDVAYAKALFRYRYSRAISKQLGLGQWPNHKGKLEEVATQHGILATAIAKLREHTIIDDDDFRESADLVQKMCHLRLAAKREEHGQWCEPYPP